MCKCKYMMCPCLFNEDVMLLISSWCSLKGHTFLIKTEGLFKYVYFKRSLTFPGFDCKDQKIPKIKSLN